ncbi:MAG TPA: uroporphyrinogen-III synthase [Burkholderiales bacterium]|jgi:uroporphyrinogen-III synthase|nr:uroporphyrinogen-III synthase [Burkholderiales bacterium]
MLAGRRILVTRPRELAQELAALIREAGGEPLLYPALEIRDAADPAPARALLARLRDFDLAVFVSPSAVRKAMELAAGLTRPAGQLWPAGLRVAAIGAGTRRELERRGFRDVIAPAGQEDSEALLALPTLAGVRQVAIFRGEGGRELLGDTLAARGARVEYAECYRRVRPAAGTAPAGRIDAICVSSGEALRNLVALLGRERVEQATLFAPNARVAGIAREIGLREPVLAGPGDAQMLAALVAYFGDAK